MVETRRGRRLALETSERLARSLCRITLVSVWGAWLVILAFSAWLVTSHPYDFEVYYAAAQALRLQHSADIYQAATLLHTAAHVDGGYVYPPLLAILLEPLTLAPLATASVIWLLLNAALWALATLALAQVLARHWPARSRLAAFTVMSIISLTFWQAYAGLYLGQVHLLVLCGMCLALWWADQRRSWLTGGALAFVVVIKFFPAVLLVYYLARRRWSVIGGAALSGALLLIVMLVASSPATLVESLPAAFASVQVQATPGENEALMIVVPLLGRVLAITVGIVFLWVVVRRSGDQLLGMGWACCTMLLISPLVWAFYLIWLLPAFCACLAALGPPTRAAWTTRGMWILLAVMYVALAYPIVLPLRPFATLGLWALTGALYWRSARDVVGSSDGAHDLTAARVALP